MKKFILFALALAFSLPLWAQQEELRELTKEERTGRRLAQEQLDAYNKRDIDAFLVPYSDDVKVFQFPETLLYEGKEKMRENYARYFNMTPDLYCKLINRIVQGNTVIDQEEVTRVRGEEPTHAIAIYKIKDEKIAEVYFIK
ncbi:nuclear transport factor 2 family protein [Litoribacter ruber]|uniref:Nuclear transport factor 2 family protein n=1 Tax=Litoribacter ruber TaxID=702568 RepID=A0AAP2CMZ7_9BACT|nr:MULTISPECIES: nuclear transport factor 2 family protein [Litoribacter]MBS9524757.1 nuclear transport factor 2 family protein [Litoribacter alkaliphilus]MBT0812660.1 nuclear transport factor 2 family protein [Litoribacter ruber]